MNKEIKIKEATQFKKFFPETHQVNFMLNNLFPCKQNQAQIKFGL